jgi:hypothetical protein
VEERLWKPEAGSEDVDSRGSKRHSSELSAAARFALKKVFWQHVGAGWEALELDDDNSEEEDEDDAEDDDDADACGDAFGIEDGSGDPRKVFEGGGKCDEGTKSGSGDCCV